jgi:hypothetical protein
MQEGADWTKELEDALERERESLKKLNQVELEKSKHQISVSKLQTQHSAVQTKLELALANAEMAAEREQREHVTTCPTNEPTAEKPNWKRLFLVLYLP